MGRHRKANISPEAVEATKEQTIRVEADLARMAHAVIAIRGGSVSKLVSPVIRPFLLRTYAEVIKSAADDLMEAER